MQDQNKKLNITQDSEVDICSSDSENELEEEDNSDEEAGS